MKKILSIVLCLTLVFSVFSLGLTANAADGDDSCKVSYSFNNGGIFVEFYIGMRNYRFTQYYVNVYKDHTVNEYYRRITQVVDVPGTFDLEGVFEEFLPECDLLERIDNHFNDRNSCNLSQNFTVSEYFAKKTNYLCFYDYFNEDDVAYIISKLNPNKLNSVTFINNRGIEDMSPIVDALLGCCKNTLYSFEIYGKTNITEVDNRIFTDFPKMETVILRGIDIWSYNSEAKLMRDVYDRPCFYAVVSIDEEINVVYGQYKYDLASYLYDYYYDNISQYFVGADNTTVQVYKVGDHIQVETYYNYNGIKASIGEEIDGYVVYEGDATGDGFTDAFDVATATEYVNNFEEPEDPAVKMAMDVVADGYIDATDLAYVSYIANFEG